MSKLTEELFCPTKKSKMAQQGFEYTSEPQSVAPNRTNKYRDENDASNIMYDRRVVRGNTYAAQVLSSVRASRRRARAHPLAAGPRRRPLAARRRRTRTRRACPPPRSPPGPAHR